MIAETTDLPTRFNRIVVTDDDGRYLLPDLPDATYDVWVRGYGLVDSEKVRTPPGSTLNLTAVVAADEAAAAQYYPAGHWLSLIEVPGADQFPGTGTRRQRHLAQRAQPGGVDAHREVGRLHGVPLARQQGDP